LPERITMESSASHVLAVVGDLMVRNTGSTLWTRLQTWDYLLGIGLGLLRAGAIRIRASI
jgi:hypothetical protein